MSDALTSATLTGALLVAALPFATTSAASGASHGGASQGGGFFPTAMCTPAADPLNVPGELEADAAALLSRVEASEPVLPRSHAEVLALRARVQECRSSITEQRERVRERARAAIAAHSDEQWERSLYSRSAPEEAASALAREWFPRDARRLREAYGVADRLLERAAELTASLEGGELSPEAQREAERELTSLEGSLVELFRSAHLNAELGVWSQVGQRGLRLLEVLGLTHRDRVEDAPRATDIDPSVYGGPPIGSSRFWRPPSLTPDQVRRGETWSSDRPPLPGPDAVCDLAQARDWRANGMHPSAGIECEGGARGTAKLFNERSMSYATFSAHLFEAAGYRAEALFALRSVKVTPRVFVAMMESRNRVGLRYAPPDDEPVLDGGRVGYTWFDPLKSVVRVARADGQVVEGREALELMQAVYEEPARRSEISWVELRHLDFEVDKDGFESIGPWHPDELGHLDLRAVRGLAVLATILGWEDAKFDNLRLSVTADGEVVGEISDPEVAELNSPAIELVGTYLHDDPHTASRIRAFDRATLEDAVFIARHLKEWWSDEMIDAAAQVSSFGDPEVAARYRALIIQRRDSYLAAIEARIEDAVRRAVAEAIQEPN